MTSKPFDASKYLTDLNGKDYLEVKWRLLWLRTEHPDAIVDTELVKHGAGLALFRARVAVPGGGTATGWGSETADDFEDFIEKAETKALGRALAALGFGTQFCEDFDFSAERERAGDAASARRRKRANRKGAPANGTSTRVVDSPVESPDGARAGQHQSLRVVRDRRDEAATSSQLNAIFAIGRDHHGGDGAVEERCRAVFGRPPGELTKRQASEFIDLLRRPAAATAKAGGPSSGQM